MNERLAHEFGTSLERLKERHRTIQEGKYPDLHEPTENIRQFAEEIPGQGAEEIKALIEKAAAALSSRRLVDFEDAHQLYLRRTAGEILGSGLVATHPESGIHGCQDFALVTMALLRAKNVQNIDFVRLLPRPLAKNNGAFQANHSIVIVKIGEKKYRIDMARKKPFVPITERRIKELKEYAMCGRDSFDVGITSASNAFIGEGKTGLPGGKSGGKGKPIS